MDESRRSLRLQYNYDILPLDPQKRAARAQLGGMAAEILEVMRDELVEAGVRMWLKYKGLTNGGESVKLGSQDNKPEAQASSDGAKEGTKEDHSTVDEKVRT